MANNYLGKNFGQFSDTANADGIATKYLNLQGLTDFWAKTKEYVDAQDAALFEATKDKIEDVDSTLRKYIESLTINGQEVTKTPPGENIVGTGLAVTLEGEDIKVRVDGTAAADGEKYADGVYTVRSAIAELDNRADAIETILAEGVVNKIEVVDTPNGTGSKNFVSFTKNEAKDVKGNNVVTLTVDETSLDSEISTINEKIVDLQANAGVTNIGVKDVDSDTPNLVSIKLTGTKANTLPDSAPTGWDEETNGTWADYKANFEANSRGDVLITLNETNLEERLDGIDTTVATEILDRKEDIANLAGTGYTIADGNTTGEWKKTEGVFNVKYRNITDISERIAQIDDNLVTTITAVDKNATQSGPNWVAFTKTDADNANGDNTVTLTVDETKLGEYITKNETNLSALGGLTVNGHQVIAVTPAAEGATHPQVTVAHTDVVLSTADITRNTTAGVAGTKNLEEQLTDYDTKFAALASATHFRGKYDTLDAAVAAVKDQGDIVIVGLKEYVYYDAAQGDDFAANYTPSKTNFIELGDVEEEQTRIENLEDWVDNNIIQEAEITAIFTANGTKPTFTF